MHNLTFYVNWDISTSLIFEYLSTLETFHNVAANKIWDDWVGSEAIKHMIESFLPSQLQ